MGVDRDRLVAVLVAQLDERELGGGVAYYAEGLLEEGESLDAPGLEARAPFASLLGFVDRAPTANWSHSCRYLLVSLESEEVLSIEAQLPPFGPAGRRRWHVAYQAAAVPDAAIAVPR